MQSLSQSQEKILMPEEYIDLVNQEASLISLGSEITSSIVDSYADNKKMKKIKEEPELDDVGSIVVEVFLQIHNRARPSAPDLLFVIRMVRKPFTAENLGMQQGPIEHRCISSR